LAKKILIVDDAGMMRMMIKEILTKNGYEVAGEARSVREAVEKYAVLKPDLVTMDVAMPDLNGIDGVKAIRRIDPNANIIMCSAKSNTVMEAIRAGAKGFVVKPFKAAQIVKTVTNVLE
jgi:two-component system chemotaxis response regulator CheY